MQQAWVRHKESNRKPAKSHPDGMGQASGEPQKAKQEQPNKNMAGRRASTEEQGKLNRKNMGQGIFWYGLVMVLEWFCCGVAMVLV